MRDLFLFVIVCYLAVVDRSCVHIRLVSPSGESWQTFKSVQQRPFCAPRSTARSVSRDWKCKKETLSAVEVRIGNVVNHH